MVNKPNSNKARLKRHARARSKISGTASCPRLDVFRSNSNIYAQLIDDVNGVTLAAASSNEKDFGISGGISGTYNRAYVARVLKSVQKNAPALRRTHGSIGNFNGSYDALRVALVRDILVNRARNHCSVFKPVFVLFRAEEPRYFAPRRNALGNHFYSLGKVFAALAAKFLFLERSHILYLRVRF